jgi:hypothetical protein
MLPSPVGEGLGVRSVGVGVGGMYVTITVMGT